MKTEGLRKTGRLRESGNTLQSRWKVAEKPL
jgi:hypothetical protein